MAEGGEIELIPLGENGYDEDGYDKDGYDKDGEPKYNEEGYDRNGFDKDGLDSDGKTFDEGYERHGLGSYGWHREENEVENIPLLPRTSTSAADGRETERPFKPRVRTSTRKGVSFANPSFHVTDGDEMETSFGGIREGVPNLDYSFELREVKKYYPHMDDSSVEVKLINGRLSVRLIGIGDEKWAPIFNKDGKLSIQFNKRLKRALGFNRDKIIKKNNEQNLNDLERITELEKDLGRDDISEEVKNTTINEINGLKEGIAERIEENEKIQNKLNLKIRIKEIFKKYGFTVTSVVTAVGVVIGVIVSKLTSGLSSMASSMANGLSNIGSKLAQLLPGMIGAIASFIFKTAGEVVGFLAKNSWLLILAVVLYFVENLKKKRKR